MEIWKLTELYYLSNQVSKPKTFWSEGGALKVERPVCAFPPGGWRGVGGTMGDNGKGPPLVSHNGKQWASRPAGLLANNSHRRHFRCKKRGAAPPPTSQDNTKISSLCIFVFVYYLNLSTTRIYPTHLPAYH